MSVMHYQLQRQNIRLIAAGICLVGFLSLAYVHFRYPGKNVGLYGNRNMLYQKQWDTDFSAAIVRAPQLRERWKPWAIQLSSVLKPLVSSHQRDTALFKRAWLALPPNIGWNNNSGKLCFKDLMKGSTQFTWQPSTNSHVPQTSSWSKREMLKTKLFVDKRELDLYNKYGDLEISRSAAGGPNTVILWASGRVTTCAMVKKEINGGYTFVDGPQKEICPPFEELNPVKK